MNPADTGRPVEITIRRLYQCGVGKNAVCSAEIVESRKLAGRSDFEDRAVCLASALFRRAVEIPVPGLDLF